MASDSHPKQLLKATIAVLLHYNDASCMEKCLLISFVTANDAIAPVRTRESSFGCFRGTDFEWFTSLTILHWRS